MIAAITGQMTKLNEVPTLQFLKPHRYATTTETEHVDKVVSIEWAFSNEQQRINLADGAINTPTAPHLSKMEYEGLDKW